MSFSAQARRPFSTDDKQGTGTISAKEWAAGTVPRGPTMLPRPAKLTIVRATVHPLHGTERNCLYLSLSASDPILASGESK